MSRGLRTPLAKTIAGMPNPWSKIYVCSTNDHPQDNNKIAFWLKNAGAHYSTTITNGTTHLLRSKKAWRRHLAIGKHIAHHAEVSFLLTCCSERGSYKTHQDRQVHLAH